MFLRAFVELRIPADGAAAILGRLPQTLVESFAIEAVDHSHGVLTDVGFPMGNHRLARTVELELGDAVVTASRTWLPLTWKATTASGFFPSLEGELEAAALGRGLTQIGLSARYKPPFGVLGSTLDRMLLHRIAEATVADFLERVAGAVESSWRLRCLAGQAGDEIPATSDIGTPEK